MKRIIILGVATTVLGIAAPSAQAACGTSCLRTKVSTLNREVTSLTTSVNSLVTQLNSMNVTLTNVANNVTNLHDQQVTDEGTLDALNGGFGNLVDCLGEYPVTDYGDPDGTFGYVYDSGSGGLEFDTTALDVTNSGDTVGAWTLFDECNTATTASIARSARLARVRGHQAIAPSFLLTPLAR
jgi:hypothetical protein